MAGKKTGIFISAINEPIVNRVMQDYGYTKISNAINFIIQEYDKLSKDNKKEIVENETPTQEIVKPFNLNEWFVAEENN